MSELELDQHPQDIQSEWSICEVVPRSLKEYFFTVEELEPLQQYSDLPLEVILPDEKNRTLYPIPQLARLKDSGGLKWCVVDLSGTDWQYAQHFFAKKLYYPDNGDMPSPIDSVSRVKGVQLAGVVGR